MCGIGGIFLKTSYNLNIKTLLKNFVLLQNHRGPDSNGIWIDTTDTVGLCHNRLSIIDLSNSANQPMISHDKRFIISYNGEIYNYIDLRNTLTQKGSTFVTNSDTEVISEAYRYWGTECLQFFRGMFAFAIFDVVNKTLFCARDKIGKKPFIYTQTEDFFAFSSEIPPLKTLPQIDLSLNHDALGSMLLHNFRHIPDPSTAYRGIKRLRPGHALLVKEGKIIKNWRYWEPQIQPTETTSQKLYELIDEAVQLRMQADVPVAALLSGGIDSTALVALMSQKQTSPVRTYALGMDKHDEDLKRARIAANAWLTEHKEFYFDPSEQWDILHKLITIYGEPIALLPLIHSYTLYQHIYNDGIKVVINGNGADELFYGYTGHIRTLKLSKNLKRGQPILKTIKPFLPPQYAWLSEKAPYIKSKFYECLAYNTWQPILSASYKKDLINLSATELAYWGKLCPSKNYIDISNFVALITENAHSVTIAGDLPAMANSIETRSPFLDHKIIDFALNTPYDKKITYRKGNYILKHILKESVKNLIPNELMNAPKRGFGMGIQEKDIFLGPWKKELIKIFNDPHDASGLFCPNAIREIWHMFIQGDIAADAISKHLAIQIWLRQ